MDTNALEVKESVLESIREDAFKYFDAPDDLKYDKDVVIEALSHSPSRQFMLDMDLPDRLLADKDVALVAVTSNGLNLHDFPDFFNDNDVVLAAVKEDGFALRFASDTLKDNDKIVQTAVASYGDAVFQASDRLQNDITVQLLSAVQNASEQTIDLTNIESTMEFQALKENASKIQQGFDNLLGEGNLSSQDAATIAVAMENGDELSIVIDKETGAVELASPESLAVMGDSYYADKEVLSLADLTSEKFSSKETDRKESSSEGSELAR